MKEDGSGEDGKRPGPGDDGKGLSPRMTVKA